MQLQTLTGAALTTFTLFAPSVQQGCPLGATSHLSALRNLNLYSTSSSSSLQPFHIVEDVRSGQILPSKPKWLPTISSTALWVMILSYFQDQVSQFLRTADELLDCSPTDLADWLPTLLASGRTQKDVYREIARSAGVVGHSATLREFCSWLFATFGVLSTQYGSLQGHETAMVGHSRAPHMTINGNDHRCTV